MHIRLLRHGIIMTGGARFEESLIGLLADYFKRLETEVRSESIVARRLFHGWENIRLLRWAYMQATGDVNITVARSALPSLLRNRKTGRKTIIVLHYFDKKDAKRSILKWYYKALFSYLRLFKPKNAAIVAVSPYYQKLFRRLLPDTEVFLVPNMFDNDRYPQGIATKDTRKVLLGQWSPKNDPALLDFAHTLKQKGFEPFFCTLTPEDAGMFPDYEIKSLSFDQYLAETASSLCSIAFPKVNEGWPRMTHESLIIGTPVIGYNKGGLGDQLQELGGNIVKTPEEAIELIEHPERLKYPSAEAVQRYHIRNADIYLKPLVEFILHGQSA